MGIGCLGWTWDIGSMGFTATALVVRIEDECIWYRQELGTGRRCLLQAMVTLALALCKKTPPITDGIPRAETRS